MNNIKENDFEVLVVSTKEIKIRTYEGYKISIPLNTIIFSNEIENLIDKKTIVINKSIENEFLKLLQLIINKLPQKEKNINCFVTSNGMGILLLSNDCEINGGYLNVSAFNDISLAIGTKGENAKYLTGEINKRFNLGLKGLNIKSVNLLKNIMKESENV
jgi:hypothetical protein